MFHFDNSYNYPVKVIQDEPNFCMIPEKFIKNNCLSTQEEMKNTQYSAIPVINSVINPPLTFDSSYIAQKLKQHTSKHQSKSIRSDLKR
jgi:hypothetical protein